MIIAGTGHRPQKCGGFLLPNPTYKHICKQTEYALKEINPSKIISGFALGYDLYLANISYKLGIPFIAAVPFIGQESVWNENQQKIYHKLLKQASEVIIVSEGNYSAHKMQIRNEYLVDNCDVLLCCYDFSSGGTQNCVSYAYRRNKNIIIIDPRVEKFNKNSLNIQIKNIKNKYHI